MPLVAVRPGTGGGQPKLSVHVTPVPHGSELDVGMPQRTGRWMVIGQVVSGLELADDISVAPLVQPRNIKPLDYTPLQPVTIESARLSCR